MCGRYSITTPPEAMGRLFGLTGAMPNFPARYNVSPTQDVPIIRGGEGGRELAFVRWGLVPSWSKSLPTSKPLINARCETINEKPSFRAAFKRRRALMPADGFYEWLRPEDGAKQPFNIHMVDDCMFAMASVWEEWAAPDGSSLQSCAIITTSANKTLEPIHHRMPVILAPEDWRAWLETPEEEAATLLPLLGPAADGLMVADAISTKVNRVANDGPDLIKPLNPGESAEEQSSLF